jgi:hypothetical protein
VRSASPFARPRHPRRVPALRRGPAAASACALALAVTLAIPAISGMVPGPGPGGERGAPGWGLVLHAQTPSGAPLGVEVVEASGRPRVTLGPVLVGEGVRASLESGLPVRIRVVTELWRVRTFDALEGRHEWRATVRLDPLTSRYLVETSGGETLDVASAEEAREALQARLAPPLRPDREGRFYYLARIEVETLSLSDLEELRRWLRGDVGGAVGGQENVGSLLGRGFRRLVVRALGLPVQRYETRTSTFERRDIE